MTYLDHLAIALETFAGKVDGVGAGEWSQLSCAEANALAHLMAVYRNDESMAVEVLLIHIDVDNEEAGELADHLEDYPALEGHLIATYGTDNPLEQLLTEAKEIVQEMEQERAQAERARQIEREN